MGEGPNANLEGLWDMLKEFVYLIITVFLFGTGSYCTVLAGLKPLTFLPLPPGAGITAGHCWVIASGHEKLSQTLLDDSP